MTPKHPPPSSSPADTQDRLRKYRQKRQRGSTPEPFGDSSPYRPGAFVVQCHDARALHYDLRLEIGGTLHSWAVPKGVSTDPAEKRLAVETEDHPLDYADFEGVIPKGNYGAGAMIVWDRGRWVSHLDPESSLTNGKLLFDLYGYKLRGLWTLVRTSRNPKEWLLIKKPDAWARETDDEEFTETSVLSGLTVHQLAEAGSLRKQAVEQLEAAAVPKAKVDQVELKPMLAQLTAEPFDRKGWLFELKHDGYRILAVKDRSQTPNKAPNPFGRGGATHLSTRNGQAVAHTFPEIARTLAALPYDQFVLDGEMVVLDADGKASFSALQSRAQTNNRFDIERATVTNPVTYMVFDLLMLEGYDLRDQPLLRRKEFLRSLLPGQGAVRYTDHIEDRGVAFYQAARKLDLEGVVAKDADSRYRPGRSEQWQKIRADKTDDFVVVGFTLSKKEPDDQGDFASLHLAVWDDGCLSYLGRVGSGFSQSVRDEIAGCLQGTVITSPASQGDMPNGPEHVWVDPTLVVEVRFSEITPAGHLRHPVFLRLRKDKDPADCRWASQSLVTSDTIQSPQPDEIEITRPNKVFWPEEGFTKGDLVAYYRSVAPQLLPWLKDRPLVLDRYPDGIHGKSFYQKNAPDFAPDWIRTVPIGSDDADPATEYFVCDNLASLLYIANLGAIPLHIWSSRVQNLTHPDWCILDLDPKQAPFEHVVTIAKTIHQLLQQLSLPSYPKTSGGSGLHILIPLGGQLTHEQSRQLAGLIAQHTVSKQPEIATTARSLAKREGKVYVDYLQNGHGRLLVAPYSARPFVRAPASAPLRWAEVSRSLSASKFNIVNLPRRIARQKSDPMAGLLDTRPDLQQALQGLLEQLS